MATFEELQNLQNIESFDTVNKLSKVLIGLEGKVGSFQGLAEGQEFSPRGSTEEQAAFSQIQFFQNTEISNLIGELGLSTSDLFRATEAGAAGRLQLQQALQERAVTAGASDFTRLQEGVQESQRTIGDVFTEFANKTDFSSLSPEAAERELAIVRNSPEIIGRLDFAQSHIDFLKAAGQDTTRLEADLANLRQRIAAPGSETAGTQFEAEGLVRGQEGFLTSEDLSGSTGSARAVPDGEGGFHVIDPVTGESFGSAATAEEAQQLQLQATGGGQGDPVGAFAPTEVDNVIDAREFVGEGGTAEVGATPGLATGTASPIFFDPSSPDALFYVPPGATEPVRITSPEQLQELAAQGLVQVNQDRLAVDQVGSFLQGQTAGAPGAGAAGPAAPGTGLLEGAAGGAAAPPGAAPGAPSDTAITDLADQVNRALSPFNQQILDLQAEFTGFKPTDLSAFRQQLEADSGLNDILNELSNVDASIAELIGIQRRVPATTLNRAKGTEIAQATLDRQRTIELGKLAAAVAPLSDLKGVLQDDLDRRTSLIDEAVDLQKEQDNFKLETIGQALDFAVSNRNMAEDEAERLFGAAVADYEIGLERAEAAAEAARDAAALEAELLADFYKAQGFVIDPQTGELAETLQLQKFIASQLAASRSGSGGSGGSVDSGEVSDALTLMLGGTLTNIKEANRKQALSDLTAISTSTVQGPFLEVGGFNPGDLARNALDRLMQSNVDDDADGPAQF